MKKIAITGKRNTEVIQQIHKQKRIRVNATRQKLTHDIVNDIPYQLECLKQMTVTCEIEDNEENEENKNMNNQYKNETISIKIKREIENKRNGYKHQDIKKEIYNETELISVYHIIQKLIQSHLKCFYCRKDVKLLYRVVRDNTQWTLDRLNNDLPHTNKNTVICCLRCNLQRRIMDKEKFEFTKQLHITKQNTIYNDNTNIDSIDRTNRTNRTDINTDIIIENNSSHPYSFDNDGENMDYTDYTTYIGYTDDC
jgi:hypothetical protein